MMKMVTRVRLRSEIQGLQDDRCDDDDDDDDDEPESIYVTDEALAFHDDLFSLICPEKPSVSPPFSSSSSSSLVVSDDRNRNNLAHLSIHDIEVNLREKHLSSYFAPIPVGPSESRILIQCQYCHLIIPYQQPMFDANLLSYLLQSHL